MDHAFAHAFIGTSALIDPAACKIIGNAIKRERLVYGGLYISCLVELVARFPTSRYKHVPRFDEIYEAAAIFAGIHRDEIMIVHTARRCHKLISAAVADSTMSALADADSVMITGLRELSQQCIEYLDSACAAAPNSILRQIISNERLHFTRAMVHASLNFGYAAEVQICKRFVRRVRAWQYCSLACMAIKGIPNDLRRTILEMY